MSFSGIGLDNRNKDHKFPPGNFKVRNNVRNGYARNSFSSRWKRHVENSAEKGCFTVKFFDGRWAFCRESHRENISQEERKNAGFLDVNFGLSDICDSDKQCLNRISHRGILTGCNPDLTMFRSVIHQDEKGCQGEEKACDKNCDLKVHRNPIDEVTQPFQKHVEILPSKEFMSKGEK